MSQLITAEPAVEPETEPEDEAAAMRRINNFFAPVISSDTFVSLLSPASTPAPRASR